MSSPSASKNAMIEPAMIRSPGVRLGFALRYPGPARRSVPGPFWVVARPNGLPATTYFCQDCSTHPSKIKSSPRNCSGKISTLQEKGISVPQEDNSPAASQCEFNHLERTTDERQDCFTLKFNSSARALRGFGQRPFFRFCFKQTFGVA